MNFISITMLQKVISKINTGHHLSEQLNNNFLLMSHSISQSHLPIYLLRIYILDGINVGKAAVSLACSVFAN